MQTRRDFLNLTAVGSASLAVQSLLSSSAQRGEAKDKRPNVLFIAVDDLNDWIGCMGGHPDSVTPNIDRLSKRGVLFTRAYCAAPACNPSRASLLTGVRPSTSGVYLNSQPWRPVMPDAITIPRHFKDHGYLVYGRGKIFHGGWSQDEESYHEYVKKGPDPAPENRPLNGIPNTAHFDWGPIDVGDEDMDDSKVVDWCVDFLEKKHDRPFFLACGLFRPHLPWYVPKKYFELYPPEKITLPNVKEDDLGDVPEAGLKMAKPQGDHKKVVDSHNWRKAVSGYLSSIRFTDTNVGRVLDALDKSGYADNTIIVLWGDHGWHLGEKLHWRKFALWEEATHAPLIVSVPNSLKGARCERTVSFMDIYPTLADLCGLRKLDAWEGVSLKPLLDDPKSSWDRPAVTTHGRLNHSVRSQRWRYIRYEDGSEELYDHDCDPMEWTNLAGEAAYAPIKDALKKWLPKTNAPDAPKGR